LLAFNSISYFLPADFLILLVAYGDFLKSFALSLSLAILSALA